ncbi:MAG: PTS mannitol transporter subunit IIABC [Deltaproteobacteria bacterium]|nr:PTS mannitol transporter subunit IIABC [Deltaproteobacteria bacterium]
MPEYLFITGKLAAAALHKILKRLAPEVHYKMKVLNISVASLMNTKWISGHLPHDHGCQKVIIPGLCEGDLSLIQELLQIPVIRGPKDLKDLPAFLGRNPIKDDYGKYHVKILAEIVDAHLMSWEEILCRAKYYRESGADIIDLGGPSQGEFKGVDKIVNKLKSDGFTVSLDTFDPDSIVQADRAGLDLLLSVNASNIEIAPKLNCKVVVIPDFGKGLASLEKNATQLDEWGVSYIMDPILDPLNFGFTKSLNRFFKTRQRHPKAEILMGLGNITELTDADSIGINALMAGVISELEIDYVLTTEVISWARGAVRELDAARKLMHYARKNRRLPKHIDDSLIVAKDPPWEPYSESELLDMHQKVEDRNYRIFLSDKWIYVFNKNDFIKAGSPEEIFPRLDVKNASHGFYLGRELERAYIALRLNKRYIQEQNLRWGYLSSIRS